MKKIGITGAIASGKSEVEKILKEKYLVIDLDVVSHKILETNAKKEVLAEFKTLDRKELGAIVFNSEEKRKKLEEIIYPKLKEFILDVFKNNENEEFIFISGALLYEAGFFDLFDKTIFVDAPPEIRLKRLQKRNNLDEVEAKKRIDIQRNIGKVFSDFVIENNTSIDELRKKVRSLILLLKN